MSKEFKISVIKINDSVTVRGLNKNGREYLWTEYADTTFEDREDNLRSLEQYFKFCQKEILHPPILKGNNLYIGSLELNYKRTIHRENLIKQLKQINDDLNFISPST
jgi:hypothetical protein